MEGWKEKGREGEKKGRRKGRRESIVSYHFVEIVQHSTLLLVEKGGRGGAAEL